MTPLDILRQAQSLGLRLDEEDGSLIVCPGSRCPEDFKSVLLAHKSELLRWLKGGEDYQATRPEPDLDLPGTYFESFPRCGPTPTRPVRGGTEVQWLVVARQILLGEFGGADKSTRQSLIVGLRGINHPAARAALASLKYNTKP